jgi:hypothetical protein
MQHNLTLVSAYLTNINQCRSVDFYIRYGQKLMNVKIPKILFIDETLLDKIPNPDPEYNTIIPYKFTDMYLADYVDKLNKFELVGNPAKDTIKYVMVQCHKTEWIKKAIEMDKYHTEQYMWIDFGIYQFIDKLNLQEEEKDKKFSDYLHRIEIQKPKLVRIPYVWLGAGVACPDIYSHICWYFAGSLFGGHKDSLLKFAELMKERCLQIIEEKSHLMWEINVWCIVYGKHPEVFELYFGNHDESIFINYAK